MEYPPYNFKKDGQWTGVAWDILKLLKKVSTVTVFQVFKFFLNEYSVKKVNFGVFKMIF